MKAYRTYWVENTTPTIPFFRHKNAPLGPKNTFSPFLVKNGSFWGAHHSSKKWYLAKTTAEKASVGPKLSKYNRGNDFGKIFFLSFFSPSWIFFRKNFSEKIRTWRTRPADTRGGHPRVGGWKMRAKTPATLSAVFFRKLIFSKKFARPCPPPPGPPPWTPHFFQIFFSVLDHRSPLLYFFLLLYYCVPLYIFTVFVHFFFNNRV